MANSLSRAAMDQQDMVTLSDLPMEVFQMIYIHLDPTDLVRCAAVSKEWRECWQRPGMLLQMMKVHFSGCLEIQRGLFNAVKPTKDQLPISVCTGDNALQLRQSNLEAFVASTFNRIARQYHNQRAERIENLVSLNIMAINNRQAITYRVGCPTYYLPSRSTFAEALRAAAYKASSTPPPLVYSRFGDLDAAWTYDDGMLCYFQYSSSDGSLVRILDIDEANEYALPFNHKEPGTGNKEVLRRLRLRDSTLVIEWAPEEQTVSTTGLSRNQWKRLEHRVTIFSISRTHKPTGTVLTFERRAEWPTAVMMAGDKGGQGNDYFVSAHTKAHYAFYQSGVALQDFSPPEFSADGFILPRAKLTIWAIPDSSTAQNSSPVTVKAWDSQTLRRSSLRDHLGSNEVTLGIDDTNVYFYINDFQQRGVDVAEVRSIVFDIPLGDGPLKSPVIREVDYQLTGPVDESALPIGSVFRSLSTMPAGASSWRQENRPFEDLITENDRSSYGISSLSSLPPPLKRQWGDRNLVGENETPDAEIKVHLRQDAVTTTFDPDKRPLSLQMRLDYWRLGSHNLGARSLGRAMIDAGKKCGDERWVIGAVTSNPPSAGDGSGSGGGAYEGIIKVCKF